MAKIVDLQAYRQKAVVQRIFGPWYKRFNESYDESSILADLSAQTLHLLAVPGEKSSAAYYELIMGALNMGTPDRFYYLAKGEQLLIVDTHLFMADQIRFEMMRRLDWISEFFCQAITLMEMVLKAGDLKLKCRNHPPQLSISHPQYDEYRELPHTEKEAFVRRLLPKALEAYHSKITS
jgi:hypothetical protein